MDNVEKLHVQLYVLLFTRYTLQALKTLSWYSGHAYRTHPDTWPHVNVQHETMVSVFLGFTIQCAFVRRRLQLELRK